MSVISTASPQLACPRLRPRSRLNRADVTLSIGRGVTSACRDAQTRQESRPVPALDPLLSSPRSSPAIALRRQGRRPRATAARRRRGARAASRWPRTTVPPSQWAPRAPRALHRAAAARLRRSRSPFARRRSPRISAIAPSPVCSPPCSTSTRPRSRARGGRALHRVGRQRARARLRRRRVARSRSASSCSAW